MNHRIIIWNGNPQLLGDGIMTTPGIKAYKTSLPSTDILEVVVAEHQYNTIFENNPFIDTLSVWSYAQADEFKKLNKQCLTKFSIVNGINTCVLDAGLALAESVENSYMKRITENGVTANRSITPHFAYAFAKQLGVKIDSTHYVVELTEKFLSNAELWKSYQEKKVVIVAPLSTSCSSRDKKQKLPANKMLAPKIWNEVLKALKSEYSFEFYAAPGENLLDLNIEQWQNTLDIRAVAARCKFADLVVSIDTGIGHLAQAMDAHILSICAAVPRSLTGLEATKGNYYCINHTHESVCNPIGIHSVTSKEIVVAIKNLIGD